MDISKLDPNWLETVSDWYTLTHEHFGVDPSEAKGIKQKRIRKWMQKRFINKSAPPEVRQYTGREVGDAEFYDFFKACSDQVSQNAARKKQRFEEAATDFSEETRQAFLSLLDGVYWFVTVSRAGENVKIEADCQPGYSRFLILHGASALQEEICRVSFESGSLIRENGEYQLTGEVLNLEDDTSAPFTIRFREVTAEVRLYRTEASQFFMSPWFHLAIVAGGILEKGSLAGNFWNDREKELLPLLAEVGQFGALGIPKEYTTERFPRVRELLEENGYRELIPLLEKVESAAPNSRKRENRIRKLVCRLNSQKYEPLFRELYGRIARSQEEYPVRAEACCSPELLRETRGKIQTGMESLGYTGSYPDFVKCGAIRGIHPVESYEKLYFVGMEKRAVFHIHCREFVVGEGLGIEFLCGTELLRKGESAGDICSCLFNAGGRRYFKTVFYDVCPESGTEETKDSLEQYVQIAVKRAELKKLTKDEQTKVNGFPYPTWVLFVLFFLICGSAFSVFMTLGFMLLGVLACLLTGQPQDILPMFTEMPWISLFLLTWALFGGAMGILTIIAMKK